MINFQEFQLFNLIDGETDGVKAHFVGSIPNKCILITFPASIDGLSIKKHLSKGKPIEVKVSTRKGLISFTARTEGLSLSPQPVLYLEYPTDFTIDNIRKEPRVDITLPIEMTFASGVKSKGEFSDISVSGGRLKIEHAGADVGDQVSIA